MKEKVEVCGAKRNTRVVVLPVNRGDGYLLFLSNSID